MTSADFLTYRKQIYFRISPGKINSLLITPAASTYLRFLKLFGLRNDVLTHPHRYASYVRQLADSSGQSFAVWLTSVHGLLQTTLPLANASGRYPRT
jgi:hypothetical protein